MAEDEQWGKYLVVFDGEPIGYYLAGTPEDAIRECRDHITCSDVKREAILGKNLKGKLLNSWEAYIEEI